MKRKILKTNLFFRLLVYLIFVTTVSGNGLYQMIYLPRDSRSLSMNQGGSAYNYIYLQKNPATLEQNQSNLGFHLINFPQSINSLQIDYSKKLLKGVFASQICILDYGNFQDKKNNYEFSAQDILLSSAFKKSIIGMFSFGISGSYYSSNIENYYSNLLLFNIGIKTQINRYRFGLGISVENLSYIFNQYTHITEKIPTLFRLSTFYKPEHLPVNINLDLYNNSENYIISIEFYPNKNILFRFGASSERKYLMTGNFQNDFFSGLSGGLSFKYKKNEIQAALKNLGSSGIITSLTLSYNIEDF
tara:strand:+ start:3335 stop:4243 length:909 start_codon:yes stop_codon:yes gene_type:complete